MLAPTRVDCEGYRGVVLFVKSDSSCLPGLEDVWIARMNSTLHLEDSPDAQPPPDRGPPRSG
jgi:hypothetical protein